MIFFEFVEVGILQQNMRSIFWEIITDERVLTEFPAGPNNMRARKTYKLDGGRSVREVDPKLASGRTIEVCIAPSNALWRHFSICLVGCIFATGRLFWDCDARACCDVDAFHHLTLCYYDDRCSVEQRRSCQ